MPFDFLGTQIQKKIKTKMENLSQSIDSMMVQLKKWQELCKKYPELTHKKNVAIDENYSYLESHINNMESDLKSLNIKYNKKIETLSLSHVTSLIEKFKHLESNLKNNRDSFCKIDKNGHICLTVGHRVQSYYVFEPIQTSLQFKRLYYFQRSNLGRCTTYCEEIDTDYFESSGDRFQQDNQTKVIQDNLIFDVDQIIETVKNDFQ